MFRMAVGHSDELDAELAAEAVLEQCRTALDDLTPDAGLLVAAHETDHEVLLRRIRKDHPDIQLIGATSAGEMSSVLGFREDSVVLTLFASDRVEFAAGIGEGVSKDPEAAVRAAVEMARPGSELTPRLCLATPSVGLVDPDVLVGLLRRELGETVGVFGGGSAVATPLTPLRDAYEICNDEVYQDAIPILLLSGDLSYSLGVANGWTPVGPRGRVTRSAGPLVQEIDGAPAVRFYEHYLGPGDPAYANPLAVFPEGSDAFYLRAPTSHDEATGAVGFAGTVPEGAVIQLTVAAVEDILDGTRSALALASEAFPEGQTPEAAMLFSCTIRKFLLGSRTGSELELTREVLGQSLPVSGLYVYGEIAPFAPGQSTRFLNETMVAVLLGTPSRS